MRSNSRLRAALENHGIRNVSAVYWKDDNWKFT
jgi:hypothetical protein